MPEEVVNSESLGWRAGLPDELKQNEAFTGFKTVGEFGKHYLEVSTKAKDLESKLGDYVPKLPDNATDEDRNLYYEALGRPKTASEYTLEGEDKNAPEWTNFWKEQFHGMGLTNQQAKVLNQSFNQQMSKLVEAHNAGLKAEMTAAEQMLRNKLGDKYDTNVELAKRMATKHLGTDFDKTFDNLTSESRFGVVKLLLKVAQLTGEDRSPQGGTNLPSGKQPALISYDKSPVPPR